MMLVTGASGFVGQKILQTYKDAIACPSLKGKSADEVKRIVIESGADTIIHTAAISDVSACEADADASYMANVQIPLFLAKANKNIKLVYFSSDQVYGGSEFEGPYTEDMARPNNVYARHKLEMEQRVLDINPNAVMLRAEWMYDYYLKKPNYFMNIINAKASIGFSPLQFRGVTYVKEVAESIDSVVKLPGGSYNYGSETAKSMYEITAEFLSLIGKNIPIENVPPAHNLFMSCEKARKYGVSFSTVEDGLKRCAKDYGYM
jgi:dTDP-4-dehydrorhamnose reductase